MAEKSAKAATAVDADGDDDADDPMIGACVVPHCPTCRNETDPEKRRAAIDRAAARALAAQAKGKSQ